MKKFFSLLFILLLLVSCEKEAAKPNVGTPELNEEKVAQPIKQETTEPEVIEPEIFEPEIVEPEPIPEPEVTEPEVTLPEETVLPEADENTITITIDCFSSKSYAVSSTRI